MGILRVPRSLKKRMGVVRNAVIVILLLIIFASHLLDSKSNTSSLVYESELERVDYNALSRDEKIEALYEMASSLHDITRDRNLKFMVDHLKILKTRKFRRSVRPDTCNGCMEYTFRNLINPIQACQGTRDIPLFIVVTTVPNEIKERTMVRQTWASLTAKNTAAVRHLFLFGGGYDEENQNIIDRESNVYGDILQEDFVDNYYNLSYKAIMGYRWVTTHCPRAKFIMRTAADNFIHIPRILGLLQNQTIDGKPADYAQIGTRITNLDVLRTPQRKWYITAEELNPKWKKYPEYCIGTAFIFHRGAAKRLLKASVNVPNFVIEDAYIGMVMHTINMSVANVPKFTVDAWELGLPKEKGCPKKEKWLSIHLANPALIHRLWILCEEKWTLP